MNPLLNGILFGLALSILTGPILFALLQAGIERGFRAGIMVGLGVWISDLIFILLAFFGVSYLLVIVKWEGFELTLGLIGGVVLFLTGILTIKGKSPIPQDQKEYLPSSYFRLALKGFLINTINPFTVIFWTTVMTTVVVDGKLSTSASSVFFSGILGTIILTDTLKVVLAKSIRNWLSPRHILLTRRISGYALLIFGVILIIRVIL